MIIPKDYYEPEVRDGYYVPSEMKRCWAASIGVLEEIDKICRRHNLKYFAEYGTLLGAVRHGGFIPWDDDFDISMKREDYMVFLKVARDELPRGYQLLSVYNNSEYDNFLSRVVNSNMISLEQDFLEANHSFPFAVGVDIFPLDYFEYNDEENATLKEMVTSVQSLINLITSDVTDISEIDEVVGGTIVRFCDMCGVPLESGKPIRQQLYILNERICSTYDSSSPYLSNIYFWVNNGNQVYKKEIFENTVRIPFEFSEICVPIGYDDKLQNAYGPNYMTPYKDGGMHDYPLYEKQKKLLFEANGKSFYKVYEWNNDELNSVRPSEPVRERREVVFLPFRAKYWKYMEEEWLRTTNEENTDVYVIPIPYYEKMTYGLNGDIHYEADGFPDYVPITPFDKYDFDTRIPDRIVIQNPYDEYDCAITTHPRFYTGMLRQVTPELVYIPYFMIDDSSLDDEKTRYTADFFVKTPGVVRADKVYLQSSPVRDLYIEKLCEFVGEDTKPVWEEKLEVREYIKPVVSEGIREEDIPQEWWKYLLDDNNEGKKVILFHTNVSDIVMLKDKYFDKLRSVLETFNQQSDVMTVIWHAHPDTQAVLEVKYPDLWDTYTEILNEYFKDDFGIYDDRADYSRSVAIADAYYGDRDAILHDFVRTGRPVMIMNVNIT